MRYRWIKTWLERLIGAQFRKNLNGEILIFRYPYSAPRTFHTMWCPPLRIVVLDSDAKVLFDKIVKPWRFVFLPPGELILEMDPDTDYGEIVPEITQKSKSQPRISRDLPIGGTDSSISVSHMLFAMFAEALSDLRSVKATCMNEKGLLDPAKLVERYEPWERGQILASAGFVLDFSPDVSWTLPRGVVPLSADLVKFENQYADDLLAASQGAVPSWRADLKAACLGCGGGGSWRSILPADGGLPVEIAWRLLRPENNIPFCNRCAARFKVTKNANIRYELGSSFWGARFQALEKWYRAVRGEAGNLPHDWNKSTHPLWPAAYGGETWETGSGAVVHIEPLWPFNVVRTPEQINLLKHAGVYDFIRTYQC
ncbi:MAG TPA: hypothetical protein VHP14_24005 [Anaerolineales bacterium]|nr:hypothetical protein [Anaerolineales bacterium]